MKATRRDDLSRLIGRKLPVVQLPWTTYGYEHSRLGTNADTSLQRIVAAGGTFVVYFFPSPVRQIPESLPRAFAAAESLLQGAAVGVVGVSTQTALAQQSMACAEEIQHLLLSDECLRLAEALPMPTRELEGRDEYESAALIVRVRAIAAAFYPLTGPPEADVVMIVSRALSEALGPPPVSPG